MAARNAAALKLDHRRSQRAPISKGLAACYEDDTGSARAVIFVFDDFELDAERLELRRAGKLLKADRTVLLTLTFTICPEHGYIPGEHFACPHHSHPGQAA
jgi:hypothetical protein